MSRFDLLKSLVRAGADRAGDRLRSVGPLATARRLVRELRDQRASIGDRALTGAVAHAPGVRSATVTARGGRLHVYLSVGNESIDFSLEPLAVRFASRGAKEISWSVEPAELARNRSVRDAVSALSGVIAQSVWAVVLQPPPDDPCGAIVDVDGPGGLRVDLRTVPAVRDAASRSAAALVFEMLTLERISVEDGTLELQIALPSLTGA